MSGFFNDIMDFFHFFVYQVGFSPFGLFVFLLILIGINIVFYFAIKKICKPKKVRVLATILGLVISVGMVGFLATTAGQAIRFTKHAVPDIMLNETEIKPIERVFIRYSIFVSKPETFNSGAIVAYKDPVNKTRYIAKIMKNLDNRQYEVIFADENGNLLVRNIDHNWITAKD